MSRERELPAWVQLLLVALLLAVVALVASMDQARAADCGSYTITEYEADQWAITDRSDAEGIQADLVGTYLNFTVGTFDGPADQYGFAGEDSRPIPDGNSIATVCPDGSVSFASTQNPAVAEAPALVPEPDALPAPAPVPEYEPVLVLHPGTGGVQEF
jgi:hypothetical protein